MRIAFISQQFDAVRGGSSLFGDVFSTIGDRHDVVIFSRDDRYEKKLWTTAPVRAWNPSRLPWLSSYVFARAAVQKVRDAHAETPFDLIVVNQVIGSPICALKKIGVPVVYIIHHPVSVDRELALAESDSFLDRLKWRFRYGRMVHVQCAIAKVFPVSTVSDGAARRIAADYHIPYDDIYVILNGINTEYFQKTKPTEPKTVLAVGSYQHPRRGFRYLLKAYRALAARGFTMMDVGRRTDSQDAALRGVSGVQVYGLVRTQDELRDLYSRASVTISTSLYEGFGLSIVESLACGTPVVAFDAGGVRDVLGAVDASLLCGLRDVGQLITRVTELDRAPHREEQAYAYRQAVVSRFTLERMAREYEEYFLKAVAGGSRL